MLDLNRYFGGAFVLNLDRSPKRFDDFVKHLSSRGVTGVQRYRAIDGQKSPPPAWWRSGPNAWGCMVSHFRLAQDCLMDGLSSYLVFEDDAILSEDFAEKLPQVMDRLHGVEWDQLYLGGQHCYVEASPPWPFRKDVVRCMDVNRTHCFAVNARFMQKFAQHVIHAPDYIESEEALHIDHQLGRLHRTRQSVTLAVHPWIVGQAAGPSTILMGDKGIPQHTEEQWWQDEGWGK